MIAVTIIVLLLSITASQQSVTNPRRQAIRSLNNSDEPQHHSEIPPTSSLSIRPINLTTTTPAIGGRPTFHNLTTVPPSPHLSAIFSKILASINDAITAWANSPLPDLTPPEFVITYGSFVFIVGAIYQGMGGLALLQHVRVLFEEIMYAMYPVAFSLVWTTALGVLFWATGAFDGSFSDAMEMAAREGWL